MTDDNSRYIVLSDLHGQYQPVENLYLRHQKELDQNKQSYLISLGDSGTLYHFNYRDETFKKRLGAYPFTYFLIRGNHDARPSKVAGAHPNDWTTEQFWGNMVWVEKQYPYIKYALDEGGVYDIPLTQKCFIHTLVLPGAFSIDKQTRLKQGWFWEKEEQLSFQEKENIVNLVTRYPTYNLVLSHTCPLSYVPKDLFTNICYPYEEDDTMEEWLDWIEHHIHYAAWCWGHYHQWREYPAFKDGHRRLMLFNTFGALLSNIVNHISTSIVCKY
ncbi:MAG: metallophosphoesterase [Prevotella sp.]|nr:metallophosphoesterase [Prevotella sp.]